MQVYRSSDLNRSVHRQMLLTDEPTAILVTPSKVMILAQDDADDGHVEIAIAIAEDLIRVGGFGEHK